MFFFRCHRGFLSFPNFFVPTRSFFFFVTVKRSRFLCVRKTVNEASAFVSDAVHQPVRPHKFCRKQTQPDKNREQARSRRDQHDYACQQQGKSGDDEEHAADLLDGAKDHRPLGKRLSGGEGGILTQTLLPSYHLFNNLRDIRMNIGDFYDLAFCNSFNPFA